ncbi:MAG: tetratricopeptide repeat protein [Mucinivorans sp.]
MRKFFIILLLVMSLSEAWAQLNKPYFYYRGRDFIVEGKYIQAIESLNILLRTESKDYEGYFLRGVAKYNLDDLSGALSDFSKAIDEQPVYTQAYQYRAITRSRMGLYTEALEDFAQAIEMRPNNSSTYYSRGITYFLNQQFKKSKEDFSRFLKIEPRQVEGYINRGTSSLYMHDTIAAITDYNSAIRVNPYWADGYMRRGLLSLARAEYDAGERDLDEAIRLDSTMAIAYFYRAMARSYQDNLRGALADFDSSLQRDSTSSIAYFNRAILRSQVGDYNRAIEDYTKVARYNPNNVLVYYNRASVWATLGFLNQAIEDYSHAIELYGDFANAYLLRSNLYGRLGNQKQSEQDRRTAEAKIAQYRSAMTDSTFSIYADTSRQFNRIMSFDADFGSRDFSRIKGDPRSEVQLLPLFRFTIDVPDSTYGYDPLRYENRRLTKFMSQSTIEGLRLSNKEPELSTARIAYLDSLNSRPDTWNDVFAKSMTQVLLSQYSSSLNYLNFAVSDSSEEPWGYLNRAATRAAMVEFIASLEGEYQAINIERDPATKLKGAGKRKWDYSEAIADLKLAAKAMPELPHTYYNLGNLLCQSGDLPGAIEQYNKAIALFPNFGEAYYNRGLVQIFLGEKTTGCMDMSKAGELGITRAYEIVKRYCTKK